MMIISSIKEVIKVLCAYSCWLKAKFRKAVLHVGINDNNGHVVAGNK